MARQYSLRTFLHQTPNRLLAAYFHRQNLLTSHSFERLRARDIGPIIAAMRELTGEQRARVEADFQDIFSLADQRGAILIAARVGYAGWDVAAQLAEMSNHYHRAMWLFLEHGGSSDSGLFRTCAMLAQVESLSFPRSKRLTGIQSNSVRTDPESLSRLSRAISHLYQLQGRGFRCKVENHLRSNPTRHVFNAYPEDYSSSEIAYIEGELGTRVRQPVFQVAFVFHPEDGVLELSAPGKRKDTQLLQAHFCTYILGEQFDIVPATPRPLRLDALKHPDFAFPTQPGENLERVELLSLRMRPIADNAGVVKFSMGDLPLHEFIDRFLTRGDYARNDLRVVQARLRFTWRAVAGERRRVSSVTLTLPDSTTLKDLPHHQIIRRSLSRWNIAP